MRAIMGRRFWQWGGLRNLRAYPEQARSFRTTTLLAIVAVFNLFDLALTHSQLPRGNFAEANLLATTLAAGPAGMALYKLLLFGAGAYVLYRYRRRWVSEAGLWVLATAYAALMVWWHLYLGAVEICVSDPAVTAPLALY